MFPIGSLNKFRVKEIANEIGLNKIARKKESVGICFVGKRPFKTFISEVILLLLLLINQSINILFILVH